MNAQGIWNRRIATVAGHGFKRQFTPEEIEQIQRERESMRERLYRRG